MEAKQVLALFDSKRSKVYERLDGLRRDVDAWIERYRSADPTINDLAELEYLLAMRAALDEITVLEDEVIQNLLSCLKPLSARPLGSGLPKKDGEAARNIIKAE